MKTHAAPKTTDMQGDASAETAASSDAEDYESVHSDHSSRVDASVEGAISSPSSPEQPQQAKQPPFELDDVPETPSAVPVAPSAADPVPEAEAGATPRDSTPLDPPNVPLSLTGSPSVPPGSWRNSIASSPAPRSSPFVKSHRTVQSLSSLRSTGGHDLFERNLSHRLEEWQAVAKESRRASIQQLFVKKREEHDEADIDWDFWGDVINDYEKVAREEPKKLSNAIQQGIPLTLRGIMWQLMSSSKDPDMEQTYSDLLKQTSTHEKAISRDLSRTFPNHEYFKEGGIPGTGTGQENLFNVVKAYSLYDDEVGYCQGLQFIVGPLLLNMPDEEAFCVLVRLMKSYDLRSHYAPNMPGLQMRLFQFDRLVEEFVPTVFMHLLRQGVKASMYASQWFLTLFGYRFPLELVASVMDLVFAEGVEAVFRFSVALLKKNETAILRLEFEDLLNFLKNDLFEAWRVVDAEPTADPDAKIEPRYHAQEFVKDALSIKITPLQLDQYSAEWDNLRREQDAHAIELENLRRINATLSVQVRSLEASLAQINEEHCDLVKQVVMSKLEREELEEELVKYKMAFAELSHRKDAVNAISPNSPAISPLPTPPAKEPPAPARNSAITAATSFFGGIRPWARRSTETSGSLAEAPEPPLATDGPLH